MYTILLTQFIAVLVITVIAIYLLLKNKVPKKLYKKLRKLKTSTKIALSVLTVSLLVLLTLSVSYPLHFALPPNMHSHAPGGKPPSLPLVSGLRFLLQQRQFERVKDIGADPNAVPAKTSSTAGVVTLQLEAKEVVAEVAKGIHFNYWTYNGQVPGPMLRVREGDIVEVVLTNHKSSLHSHNIDLHAVTGPGGGAAVTNVAPGETKSFKWKALNPGLYIYHCATPNVSTHNSHGQYGLILVEPKQGLPKVDREFYIAQGELYTSGGLGRKGLVIFDSHKLLDGIPSYVTFNGRVETTPRMKARVGEKIRMYVGNGGVNLVSSFHIIGEIFDEVYPEGAIGSETHKNIQTTTIPAGGATIVEFTLDVPGKYVLVDHALARMNKGAWAVLEVEGKPKNTDIFSSEQQSTH